MSRPVRRRRRGPTYHLASPGLPERSPSGLERRSGGDDIVDDHHVGDRSRQAGNKRRATDTVAAGSPRLGPGPARAPQQAQAWQTQEPGDLDGKEFGLVVPPPTNTSGRGGSPRHTLNSVDLERSMQIGNDPFGERSSERASIAVLETEHESAANTVESHCTL